jgi:hypothetical protein
MKSYRGLDVQLYSFLNLAAWRGWVVNATPWPLYPRELPGTHCIGGWVGPRGRSGRVWKISPPTGIRFPDRIALSESLYCLSYLGPCDERYRFHVELFFIEIHIACLFLLNTYCLFISIEILLSVSIACLFLLNTYCLFISIEILLSVSIACLFLLKYLLFVYFYWNSIVYFYCLFISIEILIACLSQSIYRSFSLTLCTFNFRRH